MKEKLKTLDILHAYLTAKCGPGMQQGKEVIFPCPYGLHSKPKLTTNAKGGTAFAHCFSCNEGGDIYKIAADLEGLSVKTDFAEITKRITDTLGIQNLNNLPTPQYKAPEIEVIKYLPAEDKDIILNQETNTQSVADQLGVSTAIVEILAQQNLIRTLPDGRICYLYRINEGITQVKARSLKDSPQKYIRLSEGKLLYGTTMPPETRFLSLAGKAYAPWHNPSTLDRPYILVTEGESDAIALYDSLYFATQKHPELKGKFQIHALAGTGGLKPQYLDYYIDKHVILIADNDTPGQKALIKNTQLLQRQAKTIHSYTPPAGVKDIRTLHNTLPDPAELISIIISAINAKKQHC